MASRIVFVSILSMQKNNNIVLEKISKVRKSISLTPSRSFPKLVLQMESNGCLPLIQKYFILFFYYQFSFLLHLLKLYWLTKLYGFQVHISTTHHLCCGFSTCIFSLFSLFFFNYWDPSQELSRVKEKLFFLLYHVHKLKMYNCR